MTRVEAPTLERLGALVEKRLGLTLQSSQADSLANALQERAGAMGARAPEAYLERLEDPAVLEVELGLLAERLVVPETYFFRNREQLRALTDVILPERIQANRASRRLRILSAGCATGEEPYTVAMLLLDLLPEADWDVEILGVDVAPSLLELARRGRYSAWSLRETPKEFRERFFEVSGREHVLTQTVRKRVRLEQRNLLQEDGTFWAKGAFDVVLCRNVIIYFSPSTMKDVIGRLSRALAPGGFLLLGHSETLRGLSTDFRLCHRGDAFYYQRLDGPAHDASALPSTGVPWGAPADARPSTLGLDNSWVDLIAGASERVAKLGQGTSTNPPAPAAGATPVAPKANGGLAAAREHLVNERFDAALEALGEMTPRAAADADALLVRAMVLTNRGRTGDAEEACKHLLAIDPVNAQANYLLALCREHRGDRRGAEEHDRLAIHLDGTWPMPRLHLGLLAQRAGDRALARRELARAMELLRQEDPARLVFFGGGLSREALVQLCRAGLRRCGPGPGDKP